MTLALVLGVSFGAFSQDKEGFTNEDLTKYATVMKWADDTKKQMGKDVGTWVKESEGLSGTKYKELSAANKKGTLEEAEATEEEMTIFKGILDKTETAKAEFKETYTTKIKEEIGAGLYNRLRKELKADAELKSRYDAIYAGLAEETEETSEDSDTSGGN